MAPAYCIECNKVVTTRHHAVSCDVCDGWVHRLCNTGIPLSEYRRMVRGEINITYYCTPCIDTVERLAEQAPAVVMVPDVVPDAVPDVVTVTIADNMLADEVFKEVKEVLGRVSVEAFMLDFEMAAWKAIRVEFPETLIKGCAFHWSQAVFRKVMNLGLSGVYRERAAGYTYIRRLMALPFLPHGHIEESFDTLKELATTEPLQALVRYMETTWIANPVWPVRTWSVYREVIRTNNDVEGWHRGLNSRAARSHLPFYIIVPLLKKEGQHVTLQHALVTQQLLSQDRRKKFAKVQGRLMTLWDRYAAGEIISSELMQACGRIYGPTEIGVTTIAEDE